MFTDQKNENFHLIWRRFWQKMSPKTIVDSKSLLFSDFWSSHLSNVSIVGAKKVKMSIFGENGDKDGDSGSKNVTRGRIFSKKYFVLTYIVIWALSKSEWKKNLFKRTNSNIEVGYPAPIFFWKFSQFCQIYNKILFTTHQSKILENWITFSAL